MRCFVGITLPDVMVSDFTNACEAIREADTGWLHEKWTSAANLHMTLAFFGDIPVQRIPELQSRLDEVFVGRRALSTNLRGLAAIPNPRRCSMIWARFEDPESQLADLASAVSTVGLDFGARPELRPFEPHVTLARSRRPLSLNGVALSQGAARLTAASQTMSDRWATLFSSNLTNNGPVYEKINTWGLADPQK